MKALKSALINNRPFCKIVSQKKPEIQPVPGTPVTPTIIPEIIPQTNPPLTNPLPEITPVPAPEIPPQS